MIRIRKTQRKQKDVRSLRSHFYLRKNFAGSTRSGYSLAEMALAILAVSLYLGSMMWAVVGGINLTVKADQRTVALALAQAKMSQLMNNPNLSPTNSDYKAMRGSGIYTGYRWKVKVSEDKVNLAEVSKSGRIAPDVSDKVPSGIQNASTKEESMGSSTSTATGGEIEIMRVTVLIKPPESSNEDWTYKVTTFQPMKKTTRSEAE